MKNLLISNVKFIWVTFAVLALVVYGVISYANLGRAQSFATVNSQLDLGSQGADVTALQAFLAYNALVYPAGLVTGHFGPLTAAAVRNFQIGYGLPAVGRVGPVTLAKINEVINSGRGVDVSGPFISDNSAVVNNQKVTVSWKTNEVAAGKVFYGTAPLVGVDAITAKTEPIIVGASVGDNTFSLAKSIDVNNLLAHQTYYYVIESIDQSGNVSVGPQNIFVTD